MPSLNHRTWVPANCEHYIQDVAAKTAGASSVDIANQIEALAEDNRQIHERDCFNLNPATNVMNPRAEALLSSGIGTRPSLGYPGDKYEMGLEAIEQIEVICAELVPRCFKRNMPKSVCHQGRLQTYMHSWPCVSLVMI